ncbi:MAG: glutamine--fructose-6-phosphate transaminase (isomerizing) [Deltaproteobacteria bacterium]|nr:glutamine--fructose-6-phosphate transaminase (isomerizing) [Deltaproteobacteria bacterium]
MCGIVGVVSREEVASRLVDSIARLEYRGYDSCGVATLNSVGLEVRKGVGPVAEVAAREGLKSAHGTFGIAHTRWATHGGVSRENAHPHLSCDGQFAVVHNGIISNHHALRRELLDRGHRFLSETDTEVIAHLIEEIYRQEAPVEEAFVQALRRLEGSFATAMIAAVEPQKILCARDKSPLILGIGDEECFVGSDVNAFLPYTRTAVELDDGEYAVISRDGFSVRAIASREIRKKRAMNIQWSPQSAEKAHYRHYMEKEICEQPDVIRRALQVPQREISELARRMSAAKRNVFVGVGTTYYVALFGQYLLAALAGEFAPALSSDEAGTLGVWDPDTLVLAISQSGETFDTLQALRHAKAGGAQTAAIVNVPGSTMTREAKLVIEQNSGPEICVISTKAAMAQMVLLIRLAAEIARLKGVDRGTASRLAAELEVLPELVQALLASQRVRIRELATRYHGMRSWFFLGRGIYTPVAYESALKMKEVTYLHAEGMAGGFLKHGTLSLIDPQTPCVFLVPNREDRELYDLTMSSMAEVRARAGRVIAFAFDEGNESFDEMVALPETSPWIAPLLHLVGAQLLAYETAVVLGRNVDRPRSLAKSVTVA